VLAYSKGITSSREIDGCCRDNIIFKALACDSQPHFSTIAQFIGSKPSDIKAKTHSGTVKELSEKRDKLKRLIQLKMQEHQQCEAFDGNADEKKRVEQTINTLTAQHDKIEHFLHTNTARIGGG